MQYPWAQGAGAHISHADVPLALSSLQTPSLSSGWLGKSRCYGTPLLQRLWKETDPGHCPVPHSSYKGYYAP